MDYENKDDYLKPKGNFFLEVAAIFIIVIIMIFSGVIFYFYKEVNHLYDDKADLLARLERIEKASGATRNQDEIRRLSAAQNKLQDQLSDRVKALNGKVITDLEQKLGVLRQRVARLEREGSAELPAAKAQDPAPVSTSKRVKVSGALEVTLLSCADRMMYFYCDVQLKNLGRSGRTVEIRNDNTLVRDYSGKSYSTSSFRFRTRLKEEVRDKADIFVSKAHPVVLQFRFYDPPSNIPAYAAAEFNIEGKIVSFGQVLAEN